MWDFNWSVGPTLASTLPSGNANSDSYIKPVYTTFNLQHTSLTEVLKVLGKLSPNKATGLENFSCRLLKEAGPVIATSLACMINIAIDISLFPSQWKMAKVFPLYKKDYRTDAQNYRPATSKISERVVYDQLYRYLNLNGLLTKKKNCLDFVPFTQQ